MAPKDRVRKRVKINGIMSQVLLSLIKVSGISIPIYPPSIFGETKGKYALFWLNVSMMEGSVIPRART